MTKKQQALEKLKVASVHIQEAIALLEETEPTMFDDMDETISQFFDKWIRKDPSKRWPE